MQIFIVSAHPKGEDGDVIFLAAGRTEEGAMARLAEVVRDNWLEPEEGEEPETLDFEDGTWEVYTLEEVLA